MASKNSSNANRTRNWSFILYPESAPDNWRDILDEEHMEWVESPLHDKDINPTGEVKKAHWHILLMFDGVKSYEQILEITESVCGTIPKKVASAKGLVRYMAHLDNPEKYQYEKSGIIGHGGADVAELLKPTASAKYVLIAEMSEYIRKANVKEYEDLWYYAMENRFDDWFPLLCDNATYCMNALIKSRRHRQERETVCTYGGRPVDLETGEIL